MRVRVVVTVEVDPKEWAHEYSMVESVLSPALRNRAVREDVRAYVEQNTSESYAAQSGLLTVA